MGLLVPLGDELVSFYRKVRLAIEVGDAEPLALQNAEPLLDLVHPGGMNRREVENKSRMVFEPGSDLLAVMGRDVVENEMNGRNRGWNFGFEIFEKRDVLPLPFAVERVAVDLTAAGVEGGEKLECAATLVFVLDMVGDIPRQCGFGRMGTRSRLKRGLFIDREHDLVVAERAGVEVDNLFDPLIELGVAGRLGAKPHVDSPGFQFVRSEDALDGGGGNGLDHAIGDELTREFGAEPGGERTLSVVRPLAGEFDQVHGRFQRGKQASVRDGVYPAILRGLGG